MSEKSSSNSVGKPNTNSTPSSSPSRRPSTATNAVTTASTVAASNASSNTDSNGNQTASNQGVPPTSVGLAPDGEGPMYLGHYRIEKTLGQGSYGKVKLATNTKTNQKVALKFIQKSNIKKPVHMTRIKREVRLLKLLHHPHIVRLYEVAETNQEIILTMEHAGGGELFDYIVAQQRLKDKEARRMFRQIVSAVDYCHRNCVIHRDLKPENLLLDVNRDIKIIDFGFANMFDPDALLGTFCGSPFYASPEMILGKKYVGPEVDIWSMGVILFALLCGHLPFDDPNMKKLYNKIIEGKFTIPEYVTANAKDLMNRMIVVDAEQRATLEEVIRHPWLCDDNDTKPPDSYLPVRNLPGPNELLDESIIAKLASYGYDVETARERIRTDPHSPAFCTYYLIKEKQDRDEEERLRKLQPPEQIEDDAVKRAETTAREAEERTLAEAQAALQQKRRARTVAASAVPQAQLAAIAATQAVAAANASSPANALPPRAHPTPVAATESTATAMPAVANAGAASASNNTAKGRRFSLDGAAHAASAAAAAVTARLRGNHNTDKTSNVTNVTEGDDENNGGLHVVKGLFNVSTTSSKPPQDIADEITRVLNLNGIKFTRAGYTFACQDISTQALIKFEIEICKIQRLALYGLHLRRVEGDTWPYKKLCHKLTSQLRL